MNLRRAAAAAALSAAVIAPLCSAPALASGAAPTAPAEASAPAAASRAAIPDAGHAGTTARPKAAPGAAAERSASAAAPEGTYVYLDSVRLLDTRNGNGSPVMLWPKGAIALQVGGRGGVPSTGVSAVVLNVTAVGPSAATWITAWPSGGTEPKTSNLNVNAGENRANLVTVAVGADGKVNFRNANGYTHLLADVVGYYSNASGVTGGAYHPLTAPHRTYDSRPLGQAFEPDSAYLVPIDAPGMDWERLDAVAVNITALSSASGYLTAWGPGDLPNASTVNFVGGRATPNAAVVPIYWDVDGPWITVYNSAGYTDVLVDIVGWYDYDAGVDGYTFTAVTPTRSLDTRVGGGPVAGGTSRLVPTTAVAPDAAAVVANVTGVSPTGSTWVGVNSTATRPAASTLNLVPGETRPNLTHAPAGASGFYVYNAVGSTNVIADVFGYFS